MEAKRYIRVNMVEAEPMTAYEFDDFKKREHSGENCEGYKVVYDDGYVSWCPKARFEEVSREIDRMNFGMAIEAMKKGHKVARKGWNGKGMYIWIMPGSVIEKCPNITDPHLKQISEINGGKIEFTGSIRMKTAGGKVLTGWLASQTDMLADDWVTV